jgi:formate hydrogenlyase subunit 4
MILEYSGPYLALIEWSAAIKQLVLMTLLINVFFPYGLSADGSPAGLAVSAALFVVKLLVLVLAVVLVETVNAKLRLFRVPELLAVAFVLSALALISTFLFRGAGG